ncbi:hypothetical protein [Marinilabilia sp.]|uniref:hypothetical protein n=1 Tax=Marinilabilia sp. TaxID=2021252 RepID=UPI0025BA35D0|nr:hypothetical protein [Marinilabilia sp.]
MSFPPCSSAPVTLRFVLPSYLSCTFFGASSIVLRPFSDLIRVEQQPNKGRRRPEEDPEKDRIEAHYAIEYQQINVFSV